nr:MAG TPA: hypothetical protein [Caudoviricetes sp.]
MAWGETAKSLCYDAFRIKCQKGIMQWQKRSRA